MQQCFACCSACGLVLIGDAMMHQVATVLSNCVALVLKGSCRASIKGNGSDRLAAVNDTNYREAKVEWTTFVRRYGPPSIVVVSPGPRVPAGRATAGMFGTILDELINALRPVPAVGWSGRPSWAAAAHGPARPASVPTVPSGLSTRLYTAPPTLRQAGTP